MYLYYFGCLSFVVVMSIFQTLGHGLNSWWPLTQLVWSGKITRIGIGDALITIRLVIWLLDLYFVFVEMTNIFHRNHSVKNVSHTSRNTDLVLSNPRSNCEWTPVLTLNLRTWSLTNHPFRPCNAYCMPHLVNNMPQGTLFCEAALCGRFRHYAEPWK